MPASNLPPGCTEQDVDDAAPGSECNECGILFRILKEEGNECPVCGEHVCDSHYDDKFDMCDSCAVKHMDKLLDD